MDGTKSAYDAAAGLYDKVAPNFTKSNKDLGNLVDDGEAAAEKQSDETVAKYGDVPVLRSLAKASTWLGGKENEALGGIVKGAGDLTAMGGNAVFHPIDAAASLEKGAEDVAEHVPIVPGLNTMMKGAKWLADLATGTTDGEYGGSVTDLGKNLLLGTKQDPGDPGKRTNADIDFYANIGGGTKAWKEQPVEAATRTITNLLPMFLGDEFLGEGKPEPEGEPPGPKAVDPFGKTQADPMGTTQADPTGKDAGRDAGDQGPRPEPDTAGTSPAETLEQSRQKVIDADAAQKVTEKASFDANGAFVRYHAKMPDPARGFAGDPAWDPAVDERLLKEGDKASQTNGDAIHRLEAARQAFKAGQDADVLAKKARGGSGLT